MPYVKTHVDTHYIFTCCNFITSIKSCVNVEWDDHLIHAATICIPYCVSDKYTWIASKLTYLLAESGRRPWISKSIIHLQGILYFNKREWICLIRIKGPHFISPQLNFDIIFELIKFDCIFEIFKALKIFKVRIFYKCRHLIWYTY